MNYEEKYKQALERAMKLVIDGYLDTITVDSIFSELKESEDEIIKNEIIAFVEQSIHRGGGTPIPQEQENKWLEWLEKHNESTITNFEIPFGASDSELQEVSYYIPEGFYAEIKDDRVVIKKVESKFKVSDWLQYRYAEPFLVEEITEQGYCNGNSCLPFEWEDEIHLWTIQDAKDGDVLATEDGRPFIIRCMVESKNDIPSAYCGINARPIEAFIITGYSPGTSKWTNSKVHPATKEQRDLLFQKMKEAGYEWDTEKKEVKKIEPKTLNADEVIEWLDKNADLFDAKWCYTKNIIEQLKQDFKL